MATSKKAKPVKWSLGSEEPEDLQDFLSNDDIVAKHKKRGEVLWPKRGPHTFAVKRLMVKPNKNGDPRISAMLVLANPKKDDAATWNGYLVWDGFNVAEGPGLRFLKRFLAGLGLTWDEFKNKTKAVDEDNERSQIVQIGRVKFGEDVTKDPTIRATVSVKAADDYNDDEHLEIARYLPLADDEDDEDDAESDEDEDDTDAESFDESDEDEDEEDDSEDEDEEDDEDEDADDDEDDEEEEEDDEDETEELREELTGLKIADLKKRAMRNLKKAKQDPDDVDIPTKKAALVEWLIEVEMGEPPF